MVYTWIFLDEEYEDVQMLIDVVEAIKSSTECESGYESDDDDSETEYLTAEQKLKEETAVRKLIIVC